MNQKNMQIARDTCRVIDFGIGSAEKKGQYKNSKYIYVATKKDIVHKGAAPYVSICTSIDIKTIRAASEWKTQDLTRTMGWHITRIDN